MVVVVVMVMSALVQAEALQDRVESHEQAPSDPPEQNGQHEAGAAAARQERIIVRAIALAVVAAVVMAPHRLLKQESMVGKSCSNGIFFPNTGGNSGS